MLRKMNRSKTSLLTLNRLFDHRGDIVDVTIWSFDHGQGVAVSKNPFQKHW